MRNSIHCVTTTLRIRKGIAGYRYRYKYISDWICRKFYQCPLGEVREKRLYQCPLGEMREKRLYLLFCAFLYSFRIYFTVCLFNLQEKIHLKKFSDI